MVKSVKKKVLLTRKLHSFALKELKKNFSITVYDGTIPMPKKELVSKIKKVDGLICFPYDVIDKEVIDASKNLKVISTYSVGFDHIDIEYAKQLGIRVGYTPEILTDATAELTLSLILDVLRRTTEGDRIIRSGSWKEIYGAYDYVGLDVKNKTLGILGLGRIGKAVAKRASSFDMEIIYHNRNRLSKTQEKSVKAKFVTMNDLITKSDVLSLHVPHTKDTEKMVNLKFLKKMKKSAFLVNTARGKIINEADLIHALEKKIIAGAALDVFANEPITKNHPLSKFNSVVLAPHIGSSTKETREKMAEITVKNLQLGINNKKPIYSVGF